MKDIFHDYWSSPRNRLMTMILLGLLAYWASNIDEETGRGEGESAAENIKAGGAALEKDIAFRAVPQGALDEVKDPFAPPEAIRPRAREAEEAPILAAAPSGAAYPTGKTAPEQDGAPVRDGKAPRLTGVIGGANQRVAVLEYNAESKVCAENESVGAYRIVQIQDDAVVVNGPGGRLRLTVGQ